MAPAPQDCHNRQGKLATYKAFFEELLAQDSDITLFELRSTLAAAQGVEIYYPLIAGLLSSLVFTLKKSLVVNERCLAKVRRARQDRQTRRMSAMRKQPERLVFSVETSVKTNFMRL